ncbi:hypothetical protein WOSG25_050050 [Weissella oryzae SG25]|uniref:Uncharacterized protein n=1 Tax=Weissella oryzae (strain DSM 25784 / JCM 18191 / LMG 30913 / SG25) TaxID=1329250 RepID=A0A069CU32_WEIOS|nr:hypothetical protein [Weissella oryzae]GAK30733.1 hypothetical protein WOSG25_050050 [Weissella oryzae SG25]
MNDKAIGGVKPLSKMTFEKSEDNTVYIEINSILNADLTLQKGLEKVGGKVTRFVYSDEQVRDILIAYENARDDEGLAEAYTWTDITPEEVIDKFLTKNTID